MGVWVITGTNRGLGLEFVNKLSKDGGNTIIATSRSMSGESLSGLKALEIKDNLHILECNTGSPESIESFGKQVATILGGGKIDFLLNNAGINAQPELSSLTLAPEALTEHINVNVIGPAKIVQVLEKNLHSGSVVMNMTSGIGSMGYSRTMEATKCTAYSISKAAVNMLTVHQASDLKEKGVIVVCMDPGVGKSARSSDQRQLLII